MVNLGGNPGLIRNKIKGAINKLLNAQSFYTPCTLTIFMKCCLQASLLFRLVILGNHEYFIASN